MRRIAANRLIEPDELDRRIRAAMKAEESVAVRTVADWFDAADEVAEVAEVAMQLAQLRVRDNFHPSNGAIYRLRNGSA